MTETQSFKTSYTINYSRTCVYLQKFQILGFHGVPGTSNNSDGSGVEVLQFHVEGNGILKAKSRLDLNEKN